MDAKRKEFSAVAVVTRYPSKRGSKPDRSHIWTGLCVVLAGVILLGIANNYTYAQFPFVQYIWPIVLMAGIVMAAKATQNVMLSVLLSFAALAAFVSYLFGIHFWTLMSAILLMWAGAFLLVMLGEKLLGPREPGT